MPPKWVLSREMLPGIEPHIGFVDSTGRHVSLEEVARGTGRYAWTIEDEDSVSDAAADQMHAGREAGEAGDMRRAMACFREAHRLSPRWAQPVYQGAWTALLLGDGALAESLYDWTDRMVPGGYWTTKEALDCLRREKSGEFPRGSYLRYAMFEFTDHDQRRDSLERMVKELPEFSPAWKDLAVLRDTTEGRAEAVKHGLASRPDRETHAFLLIHKAQLLEDEGLTDEAATLLEGLLNPTVGTLQTRSLARLRLLTMATQER